MSDFTIHIHPDTYKELISGFTEPPEGLFIYTAFRGKATPIGSYLSYEAAIDDVNKKFVGVVFEQDEDPRRWNGRDSNGEPFFIFKTEIKRQYK